MKTLAEEDGMFGGRLMSRGVVLGAKGFACVLLLFSLVMPAAGNAKSSRHLWATTSDLPAAAQSAISAAMGRDQQAYHAVATRKGFTVKNPRSGLQATFTRQGVRVETGKASWGMALAAFGASGNLQPVAVEKPQANQNRVEYRRGALTEWYVNGPAGLEQGLTIAKAPAGSANGTIELALRLTGNLMASVDAAKTGLILKGKQTSLRYTGLSARDAKGRKLRSWLEVRKGRLLVQVAAAGAAYPLVVDPWIQVAKLVDPDGATSDRLGLSVAMNSDGTTAVALNGRGDAYVFTAASNWGQAAKLTPSQPSNMNGYYYETQQVAVSSDGSVVVVGSPVVFSGTGAAFVFVEPSPGGWSSASSPVSETAVLHPTDDSSYHSLGYSVALSADGKTVVAGAPWAPYFSNTTPGPGAAYVFDEPGGGWSSASSSLNETAKLVASDPHAGAFLGGSVSISADASTVAVGASGYHSYWSIGTDITPGAAYVFVRPGSAWTGGANDPQPEDAKLLASDGQNGDLFGTSVAVSGDGSTVVAGAQWAPFVTHRYSPGPGAAYVFVKPSGGWTGGANDPQPEDSELLASDGHIDWLGTSVAVSGDGSTVVAGAPYALNDSASQTGAVYVFTKPSGGWSGSANSQLNETDKVAASDGNGGDELGFSASMSADGLKVAVGAPFATVNSNTQQGAAYVFTSNVPFESFDASKLEITLGPPSSFQMNGSFVLGGTSDGIDPVTEPVTLQIGSLSLTIPAGSFQQQKNGNYAFSGVVDGVTLNVEIKYLGANAYSFKVEGSSPKALSIANPVAVTLTIGNDTGTWTGTVPIN